MGGLEETKETRGHHLRNKAKLDEWMVRVSQCTTKRRQNLESQMQQLQQSYHEALQMKNRLKQYKNI